MNRYTAYKSKHSNLLFLLPRNTLVIQGRDPKERMPRIELHDNCCIGYSLEYRTTENIPKWFEYTNKVYEVYYNKERDKVL